MTVCRKIASFTSLDEAYRSLLGRPVPETFSAPESVPYATGRSFSLNILTDTTTRACLDQRLGGLQGYREAVALMSEFQTTANLRNPDDPQGTADPNSITEYEIMQRSWPAAQARGGNFEEELRTVIGRTNTTLHMVLGLAYFLTTEQPTTPATTTGGTQVPPPQQVVSQPWYEQPGTWVAVGAGLAILGLAFAIRRTNAARVELEGRMGEFRTRFTDLTTRLTGRAGEVVPRQTELAAELARVRTELAAARSARDASKIARLEARIVEIQGLQDIGPLAADAQALGGHNAFTLLRGP